MGRPKIGESAEYKERSIPKWATKAPVIYDRYAVHQTKSRESILGCKVWDKKRGIRLCKRMTNRGIVFVLFIEGKQRVLSEVEILRIAANDKMNKAIAMFKSGKTKKQACRLTGASYDLFCLLTKGESR